MFCSSYLEHLAITYVRTERSALPQSLSSALAVLASVMHCSWSEVDGSGTAWLEVVVVKLVVQTAEEKVTLSKATDHDNYYN